MATAARTMRAEHFRLEAVRRLNRTLAEAAARALAEADGRPIQLKYLFQPDRVQAMIAGPAADPPGPGFTAALAPGTVAAAVLFKDGALHWLRFDRRGGRLALNAYRIVH